MSLATASPLSSFTASLVYEATNQQVPGSPISPFPHNNISTTRVSSQRGGLYSPSSGSPLALVPDGGSPLLRHLLVCKQDITTSQHKCYGFARAGRKRKRDADSTPSPSPGSERSGRDSPRVPNSIIIVKRTAIFTRKEKGKNGIAYTPTHTHTHTRLHRGTSGANDTYISSRR